MKTLLITLASVALTSCVLANAFYQKKQFYPSVIYITRSSSCMTVVYLQAFICVLLVGKLFRFIFFGELRPTETENLIERSWHAISETCLAFTVFRDDLNAKFIALFTLLFFLKCFHWLAEDRVDFMERSPNISLLFHFRIASLLFILSLLDLMFISFAYHSTMLKGASVQLVFGFEYAILLAVIITIVIKYLLHRYDLEQRDVPWENKGVYLLYFELLVGFYKVILYVSFIVVMARIHSFPLFAIRPMYLSLKAFQKALNDVILSRRAIRNMNTLYPNATPEELANADNVCIICREEMAGNGTAKKLPCNHIFHVSCLRSWFQRQQTCPTCRMNILDPSASTGNRQQQQAQQQQQNNNANGNNRAPQAAAGGQANQPANAQQQPQVPQLNANLHGIMFGNLDFVDNFFQQQERQQQQRQGNQRATSSDRNTSTTGQSASNRTAGTTRITNAMFSPPFMGLSFMPFLPFPPAAAAATSSGAQSNQSPPNLGQLSEEELRSLEGNERSALEARIRLLQQLRTSIDAIVLQFQQYNQMIVQSSNVGVQTAGNVPRNANAGQTADANSSTSGASSGHKEEERLRASTGEVKVERSEEEKCKATSSKSDETHSERKAAEKNGDEPGGETKESKPANDSSEEKPKLLSDNLEEEVRQLRLRKFISNQTTAASSSDSDGGLAQGEERKKD